MLGAADALRTTIGAPLSPNERASAERIVAALRAALGAATYEIAWTEGRALPLEQAIAAALHE